ncbi:Hcp family type VI secretion system effector [Salmonella enterica]|uniref:Hcp family type VI secretion system effector n=1 Tax=Salmonella enterica TaxID=28901 RepID=UPI000EFB461D|nr:type VI secretion system tube protein Hcp [Salmonella enterica]
MRKAGGNPLEYLKYTFTDLIVAVVSPSGSHDGEIASRETVELSVTNLDFDHYIDRASPNLFKYCASGKHIPQAILVMRKAGGNPLEYLKYTFTDLIVAVVSPSGSHDGEIASRETVELSFSTVKQEYVVQNQQGGSGGTITAGYDFKANKEI